MLKLFQGGKSTFERELNVLSDCKCEFIIKLYAIYEFPDGKGLILEYSQRSLGSFLHDKPPNIENEKFYHLGHVVRWMRCAAEGLRYLHNASPEPIIHRDVKPDNCLLFDDGLSLKLADFGVTRHGNVSMTAMAGSVIWMAPEVANSTEYTVKVDTYSWAIMFWECLTRKIPYFNCRYMQDAEEKSKLTQYMVLQMKQKEPPLPIENLPFPFGPLLDECWAVDVDKRPSMTGKYWMSTRKSISLM
jgi:serine/threonine protein kinase